MVTESTLIGTPVNRIDGRRKVTGQALYAAEANLPSLAYAALVGSVVPRGRIARMDVSAAEQAPGVLLVLTHRNRGSLGKMPTGKDPRGMTPEVRPPLEDDAIHYYGQYVAMIVARTAEAARHAASLIDLDYEQAPFAVRMEDALEAGYRPKQVLGEDLAVHRGDVDGALAGAEVRRDTTYTTPNEHPCAMEPHATIAVYDGENLLVHNSTQWVLGDRAVLAAALRLPEDRVEVLAPFVGGMFGSKVNTGWHTLLAALASMRLRRPVKVVLTRQQVFMETGHRTETRQRFEIGAARDGTLVALRHHTRSHTGANEAQDEDEFVEPTSAASRLLYACPNFEATHECVRLHVMKPGWMRAPGEAPCTWALESALDELAYTLGIDPVELRRRNHTEIDPQEGTPFSGKHLLECYARGAERFGWDRRDPTPGSMRDGGELIGWGMATATHPGYRMGATVRVRLQREDAGVVGVVSTAGIDVGTGMYTMLAVTAAEGLGLPLARVIAELGDSDFPECSMAGGSNLTASTAPAILEACADIRRQLLNLAGPRLGAPNGGELRFADGRISKGSDPSQSVSYAELLAQAGRDSLEAERKTERGRTHDERFTYQSFGAQFVEVRVQPELARVRVSRVVSVFDVGRVISAKTARSQFIGGIVFGIGQALMEELVYDPAHGQPVNADLAGYLVPVHADVPDIDVTWIDAPDLNFNPVGCRGVGEIGITGVAAAIGNAVYHATGKRVRDLPITPERLLRTPAAAG